MKLDEVKTIIKTANAQTKEAFSEINALIIEQNKRIDELVAASTNPDITDEEFNTDMRELQTQGQALANIVQNAGTPASRATSNVVRPTPI